MMTYKEANEWVQKAMPLGIKWLEKEPNSLYEPMRYMLNGGGKRLRPTLAVMCASLFWKGNDADRMQRMVYPCMAVEIFHNFTLIHDDIMDHSDMRHGMATVVKQYGDNAAILSGDAMMIEAYRILSLAPSDKHSDIYYAFTRMALDLCEGQQMDMDFETRDDVRLDEYMEMIKKKTGVLLGMSAKLGALVGGSEFGEAQMLYKFGETLGVAFQVMDDYLDLYGDEETFGKKIGGDVREGKKTYLLLKAQQLLGKKRESHMLRRWIKAKDVTADEQIKAVRDLYDQSGVQEAVKEEMRRLNKVALQELSQLKIERKWDDAHVQPLIDFADKMLNRTK